MTKHFFGLAAILAVGLLAVPARADRETHMPGKLLVSDDAKVFSPAGVDQAKKTLGDTLFDEGLSVRVSTFAHPPENKKAEAEAAKHDAAKMRKFMQRWAQEQAHNEGAKDIFVLICKNPGGIGVHVDDKTRDRGFTDADTAKLDEILTKAFQDSLSPEHISTPESVTIRDAGLKAAAEYVVTKLKDTTVKHSANAGQTKDNQRSTASPLMGYICMGIVGLLGAWLVIGLIRAFRGGGGGPGGGGFMTSLFGGLFGAMAGMWLYSNLFGGGGMFGGGSDAYAGDGGSGMGADDGTGHFGGDPEAGGYDAGGDGGGDWGGGGGDFGGGGDW